MNVRTEAPADSRRAHAVAAAVWDCCMLMGSCA